VRRLAVALAAAWAAAAGAEPLAHPWSVQARAARAEVRLGEPFGYELEIRHAPAESYALPAELALGPFEAEAPRCAREAAGDGVTTTCTMRLALFELGAHDVPAIPLAVRTPAGDARLAVPGPRITGAGVVDPAADPAALALRDPAPPVPLLVPTWRPLVAGGALLAALALAIAVARAARRARRRASPPVAPPVAPEARLLARLDALGASGCDARAFAFALSEAVREHVAALAAIPALELTTGELVERLGRADNPRLDAGEVGAGLERLDVVKFAGGELTPAQRAGALRWARRLVGGTTTASATPQPPAVHPERSADAPATARSRGTRHR
jgi:hypothetical protein